MTVDLDELREQVRARDAWPATEAGAEGHCGCGQPSECACASVARALSVGQYQAGPPVVAVGEPLPLITGRCR